MAERDEPADVHTLLEDGHVIAKTNHIINFAASLPFKRAWTFNFPCAVFPTSWSVRLKFKKLSNDNNVSCLVVIKRTDRQDHIAVDAGFEMILLPDSAIELPVVYFTPRYMTPGEKRKRTVPTLISHEVLHQLGDEDMQVEIAFDVHGCHKTIATEEED